MKVFLFLLFAGKSATAVNPFDAMMNNAFYGFHDCTAIKQAHIDSLFPNTCSRKTSGQLEQDGLDILKYLIFNEGRNLAEKKSACLQDYSNALMKSQVSLTEYRQKLTTSWLNRKKAEMLIKECQKIDTSLSQSSQLNQVRVLNHLTPFERDYLAENHPELQLKYYPLCRNPRQMSTLKILIDLSDQAAPFFSSSDVYKLLEKNRSMVISEKTGRPVTDEEIRDIDLNGENIFVKPDPLKLPAFFKSLENYFAQKKEDRNHFIAELGGEFSNGKLKKLFEEGSAREAMDDLGLSKKAAQAHSDIARMHFCMRSLYEDNLVVDLGETTVLVVLAEWLLPAGIAVGATRIKQVASLFNSRIGRIGKSSIVQFIATSPGVIKSCEKIRPGDQQIKGRSNDPSTDLGGLPNEFDFDLFNLGSLPMDVIKSCSNLGMNRFYVMWCFFSSETFFTDLV